MHVKVKNVHEHYKYMHRIIAPFTTKVYTPQIFHLLRESDILLGDFLSLSSYANCDYILCWYMSSRAKRSPPRSRYGEAGKQSPAFEWVEIATALQAS